MPAACGSAQVPGTLALPLTQKFPAYIIILVDFIRNMSFRQGKT
jgi:hypothetical protein